MRPWIIPWTVVPPLLWQTRSITSDNLQILVDILAHFNSIETISPIWKLVIIDDAKGKMHSIIGPQARQHRPTEYESMKTSCLDGGS